MIRLRDILSEAEMHAQTQRESLKAIWQLKVNHSKEPEIMKLLTQLEKKILLKVKTDIIITFLNVADAEKN